MRRDVTITDEIPLPTGTAETRGFRWLMALPLRAYRERLRRALRLYGIRGIALPALRAVRHSLARKAAPDPFDLRYGTETARQLRLEGLNVRGHNREHGVRYQASDSEEVRTLLSDLHIDYSDFCFVDIGSGKGRVVLIASTLPFKKVVGVEFSDELHRMAQLNVERFHLAERRSGPIELVCTDAADYEFPLAPLVVYMYNPFTEPVMRELVANLRMSLDRVPRPCLVLLVGDQSHSATLVDGGFREVRRGVFSGD